MTTTKNVAGIKPIFSKIPSHQLPSQSVILRLAASVSPALLEIQILKPSHQNHKLWGLAQQSGFWCMFKFENHWLTPTMLGDLSDAHTM